MFVSTRQGCLLSLVTTLTVTPGKGAVSVVCVADLMSPGRWASGLPVGDFVDSIS